MSGNFMQGFVSPDNSVAMEHRDGIPWWDAPIPRRLHRCKPQTNGWINYLTYVQRCACGAIRMSHGWQGRNSKRANR